MNAAPTLDVLLTPAEFTRLRERDLSRTVCVVFDVLRATSTMVQALANGAARIIPVADITQALAVKTQEPSALLVGERDGLRIRAAQTGGVDFDLGNSPREFTAERVSGRTIIMTTTNGTRALRACVRAREVFVGTFLNLSATLTRLQELAPPALVLVCAGTGDQASFEDTLGAGAVANALWASFAGGKISDSAQIARQLYFRWQDDLVGGMLLSRNAQRLLACPDLKEDVAFCFRKNWCDLVAKLSPDGSVTRERALGG